MGAWPALFAHPETGETINIYTGYYDPGPEVPPYKVGDVVRAFVDKSDPGSGHLLDDVYLDEYESESSRWWVVIKDRKFIAVAPFERDDETKGIKEQRGRLLAIHEIRPEPESSWSDEVWARRAKMDREHQEIEKRKQALYYGKTTDQRLILSISDFTRMKMNEGSMFEAVVPAIEALMDFDETKPSEDPDDIAFIEKIVPPIPAEFKPKTVPFESQAPTPAPWPLGQNREMDEHAANLGLKHWSCISIQGNSHWLRKDGFVYEWHGRGAYPDALREVDAGHPMQIC